MNFVNSEFFKRLTKNKKHTVKKLGFLGLSLFICLNEGLAEDWKGTPDSREYRLGVMTGFGFVNSSVGPPLIGTASKKIVSHGFIPQINNSVSLEAYLGPVFVKDVTALAYSFHMRWDFEKDDDWTLYALAGLGGNYVSKNSSNHLDVSLRLGVGAFWKMTSTVHGRVELSHDLIGLGVSFPF